MADAEVTQSSALVIKQFLWRQLRGRLVLGSPLLTSIGPKPVAGDEDTISLRTPDGKIITIRFEVEIINA